MADKRDYYEILGVDIDVETVLADGDDRTCRIAEEGDRVGGVGVPAVGDEVPGADHHAVVVDLELRAGGLAHDGGGQCRVAAARDGERLLERHLGEVQQDAEEVARLVRTRDVVRLVLDEELLHGVEADGLGEPRLDRERRLVEPRAVDGREDAVEARDALQVVDGGVVRVQRAVIAEQAVAVAHERIVRILELAPLPELCRDDVLFLEDVVDVGHAVAVRAGKGCGIVGMNTGTASDAGNIMVLWDHTNSVRVWARKCTGPVPGPGDAVGIVYWTPGSFQ